MATKINFANLCEYHLTGARYERIRAAWYTKHNQVGKAAVCHGMALKHRKAAEDALMGISDKDDTQQTTSKNPQRSNGFY
jgi:hypothetical protein